MQENADGSTRLTALVNGQHQALWVWATTASEPNDQPWVTNVRVGALPYPIVEQAKQRAAQAEVLDSTHLITGMFAWLLAVTALAFLGTAVTRR